jgi:hypothetical protein
MPYAAENKISMASFEGGVEITESQYQEALAGIMSGQIVTVEGGFAVIDKPEPPAPEPEPEKTPEEKLTEWRNGASISKVGFCVGLIGLGILSADDAVSASRGNWPAPMADFLAYLTPEQAAMVQIEWASRTELRRMNTFVLTLASWLGLPDTTVDALFGWSDAE